MVQQKPNFNEDRAVNKPRSVNDDAVVLEPDPDPSFTKPKRVLTEAQRLAFLKGREKRMANIERKRQEKLEAESVTEEDDAASPPVASRVCSSPVKTATEQIHREPELDDAAGSASVNEEQTAKTIVAPIPEMPTLRRHANSDETATKIADLILSRMEAGLKRRTPEALTPPRPPKKPRGRPRVREIPIRELPSSDDDSSFSPSPPASSVPPQRVFNWM